MALIVSVPATVKVTKGPPSFQVAVDTALGAGGRAFKSPRPDQREQLIYCNAGFRPGSLSYLRLKLRRLSHRLNRMHRTLWGFRSNVNAIPDDSERHSGMIPNGVPG